MLVCLLGQICRHSRTFLFLYELTDLSHCIWLKAIVKVSYMRKHLFFNVEPLVSIYIYILHVKNIIVAAFFARFFSADPKNLWGKNFVCYCNLKYTLILWLLHAETITSLAFKIPCWFSEVPSFFYNIIFNPCSICTRTLYSCEEPAFNGYCTRSHICPQTGNVDSPHIMADLSLESLITFLLRMKENTS